MEKKTEKSDKTAECWKYRSTELGNGDFNFVTKYSLIGTEMRKD